MSIEGKIKEIESRKRLQELAGILSNRDDDGERKWVELQKEMEYLLSSIKKIHPHD